MTLRIYIYLLFFACFHLGFSQQIKINNTTPLKQLITENLVFGCIEVSNISSSKNGSVDGLSSFGYFEKASSSFPFDNGIILSTGNAKSAGNTLNTNPLNEGSPEWGTDTDLETALNISNTLNATSIEFDFISVSNQLEFNYILASEEYFREYPCLYSDGFAFLIKTANTAEPYRNIALIPGSGTSVNTQTIHDEIVGFCEAQNNQYFEGYNVGDTNFNGRTTVLTASTSILPNVKYHIKLIIADQDDQNFDSAVFIQGNSFNDNIELGDDVKTCQKAYTINADNGNELATYSWFKNDNLIASETNSSITVVESGLYKVVINNPINNSNCTIEDSINVTLNTIDETNTFSDFNKCASSTNSNQANFNMSEKNDEIYTVFPAENHNISYHESKIDAVNNTNPLTNYTNTSSPQTIYVRALNTNTSCLNIATFNLVVNHPPAIITPDPLIICDNFSKTIILSNQDPKITNNNDNIIISYHATKDDAENNQSPLKSPYAAKETIEELFVRAVAKNATCPAFTTLQIEILESPEINSQTQKIDACETDDDGFEVFDLTTIIENVTLGNTNLTTSFHTTLSDVFANNNPIENPSAFANTTPEMQLIYMRVKGDNDCFSIVIIELHTTLLDTGTNRNEITECDDISNDGISQFNLQQVEQTIINGLDDTNVVFYHTENDRDTNTNAINKTLPFEVTNQTTLYITLKNSYCKFNAEIKLRVNPIQPIQNLEKQIICDTDDDSLTTIQLNNYNDYVSATIPNPKVSYFLNMESAQNNNNPLDSTYTNTSANFKLFVKVTNTNTQCFDIKPLSFKINPAPSSQTPSPIFVCNSNQSTEATVNLDAKIPEMVNNTTGLEFSFYLNAENAETKSEPILNSETYTTSSKTVFCRIENKTTTCFKIEPLLITINNRPEITDVSDFIICENDNDNKESFFMTEKDIEIINNQTQKIVSYYEIEADAINRSTNKINENRAYTNTTNPQRVYYRIENITDPNCFNVGAFNLVVKQNPSYTPPESLFLCDLTDNDEKETFDLTPIKNTILKNSPDQLTISFYETFENAETTQNAIPLRYKNKTNPQQIYAAISKDNGCTVIEPFLLNVIQTPQTNPASPLVSCNNNFKGETTFNLTEAENEILGIRPNNIDISYFKTLDDLNANTNTIAAPETYNSSADTETVYIKLTNTITNCFSFVPLNLETISPPEFNSISTFETCDNLDKTFDLSELPNAISLTQLNTVTISFHNSFEDASNNEFPLANPFKYKSSLNTIYARSENRTTHCYNVKEITLKINSIPEIQNVPNLENCDDDFDNFLVFDISVQSQKALGNLNPNNYNISYYLSQNSAQSKTEPITTLDYEVENEQRFYIRLENNTTGCFNTTSFLAKINRIPLLAIHDKTLCKENTPLNVTAETNYEGDTYLWSTNETTSSINITKTGTYSVKITTITGCEATTSFNVIESESPEIKVTQVANFTDPNTITVEVSGIGDYLYKLDDGDFQESGTFTNASLGSHTIHIVDLNGCELISQDIIVIDTPKFFTPNNDGYFDTWHISGVKQLVGTQVKIYNRYGKLLCILTHKDEGWNGTLNGNPLPATDYWFVANVVDGNSTFKVKGHFTLKR